MKERKESVVHVIDLFSGAGGFTTGVHLAGQKVSLCVDKWMPGVSMHYANFPESQHLVMELGGDVDEFVQNIRRYVTTCLPEDADWHLHGSPPCQSFSIAQRGKVNSKQPKEFVEEDERSNLTQWFLQVVRTLQPPSWSMEQVPTALSYIKGKAPWIFEQDSHVKIYPSVYGHEMGAPTMRKRMYIGQGWDLTDDTLPYLSKKRKCLIEKISMRSLVPALCDELCKETGKNDKQIAIKTSTNKYCLSRREKEVALREWNQQENGHNKSTKPPVNRWVDVEQGEGLKTFDESCFAIIASYGLNLYEQVGTEPHPPEHIHGKTQKQGQWKKVRALRVQELAAIQGFPSTYDASVESVSVKYFDSFENLFQNKIRTVDVKLTESNRIRGIGNSVIPPIAKHLLESVVATSHHSMAEQESVNKDQIDVAVSPPRQNTTQTMHNPSLETPPSCGILHYGKVEKVQHKNLNSRKSLEMHLVNEGLRSDRVKQSNYPQWKTKQLEYWATPRLSGSGACRVLTKRGVSDLANQLRFESEYVARYPDEATRGIVVNPLFAEYMQGLPPNWTRVVPLSASKSNNNMARLPEKQRIQALDLFTGCGGLTLGLHPWVQSIGYCENHPKYAKIIDARIQSGDLDHATIFRDVKTLSTDELTQDSVIQTLPRKVNSIDLICAGFPCQNISNAGDKSGFDGDKSSLFYEVRRLIHHMRPKYVFLENVSAITCPNMASVLSTVIKSLDIEGYNAQWGVFEARHAGAPHRRKRWFLFATRRDVDVQALRAIIPPISAVQQTAMAQQWKPEPALDQRLLMRAEHDTRTRLETMGNMVCVPQAALAFRYLVHGGFVNE